MNENKISKTFGDVVGFLTPFAMLYVLIMGFVALCTCIGSCQTTTVSKPTVKMSFGRTAAFALLAMLVTVVVVYILTFTLL